MPARIDPATYHRLAKPRTPEEAATALEAFDKELYDLRVKHGIPDLSYSAVVYVDSDQHAVIVMGHFGDSRRQLPMAAEVFKTLRHREAETVLAMAGRSPSGEELPREPAEGEGG